MWFNTRCLRPGLVLHGRGKTLYAKAIREVLNRGISPGHDLCWGNHDAIIVYDAGRETYAVGESRPMRAQVTPLAHYEQMINAAQYEVRVFEVVNATHADGVAASVWWKHNVCGTWYDFYGIYRLWLQYVRGKLRLRREGWEWASWCTEGVADAWRNATGLDPWAKENPTPYTTEKRVMQGKLKDITAEVVVIK